MKKSKNLYCEAGSRIRVKGSEREVFAKVLEVKGTVITATVYDKIGHDFKPHTFTADIPVGNIIEVVRL